MSGLLGTSGSLPFCPASVQLAPQRVGVDAALVVLPPASIATRLVRSLRRIGLPGLLGHSLFLRKGRANPFEYFFHGQLFFHATIIGPPD